VLEIPFEILRISGKKLKGKASANVPRQSLAAERSRLDLLQQSGKADGTKQSCAQTSKDPEKTGD
jgi:hypothetical protein